MPVQQFFDCVPGSRTQPTSIAGIEFDYSAKFSLTARTEQLKMHRQEFIYSEGKVASLPLLHDAARFFEGQVASTLGIVHVHKHAANRISVRTLKKATS